jgi:apoptosis-inducing factor 3
VTSVDTRSKTVTLKDLSGADTPLSIVPYTILILAPGSTPRRLPIPGADLPNVYTIRSFEDAQKIDEASMEGLKGKKFVVVGTSFISMEISGVLAKRKVSSVDIIGTADVPFENVLGEEVGRGMQKVI